MITSSRHILKAAVAIGLLTGLGACTNDMHYTGAETPKRNEVRMVRLVHDMRFDVAKATLSDAERARLHGFLERTLAGQGLRGTIMWLVRPGRLA